MQHPASDDVIEWSIIPPLILQARIVERRAERNAKFVLVVCKPEPQYYEHATSGFTDAFAETARGRLATSLLELTDEEIEKFDPAAALQPDAIRGTTLHGDGAGFGPPKEGDIMYQREIGLVTPSLHLDTVHFPAVSSMSVHRVAYCEEGLWHWSTITVPMQAIPYWSNSSEVQWQFNFRDHPGVTGVKLHVRSNTGFYADRDVATDCLELSEATGLPLMTLRNLSVSTGYTAVAWPRMSNGRLGRPSLPVRVCTLPDVTVAVDDVGDTYIRVRVGRPANVANAQRGFQPDDGRIDECIVRLWEDPTPSLFRSAARLSLDKAPHHYPCQRREVIFKHIGPGAWSEATISGLRPGAVHFMNVLARTATVSFAEPLRLRLQTRLETRLFPLIECSDQHVRFRCTLQPVVKPPPFSVLVQYPAESDLFNDRNEIYPYIGQKVKRLKDGHLWSLPAVGVKGTPELPSPDFEQYYEFTATSLRRGTRHVVHATAPEACFARLDPASCYQVTWRLMSRRRPFVADAVPSVLDRAASPDNNTPTQPPQRPVPSDDVFASPPSRPYLFSTPTEPMSKCVCRGATFVVVAWAICGPAPVVALERPPGRPRLHPAVRDLEAPSASKGHYYYLEPLPFLPGAKVDDLSDDEVEEAAEAVVGLGLQTRVVNREPLVEMPRVRCVLAKAYSLVLSTTRVSALPANPCNPLNLVDRKPLPSNASQDDLTSTSRGTAQLRPEGGGDQLSLSGLSKASVTTTTITSSTTRRAPPVFPGPDGSLMAADAAAAAALPVGRATAATPPTGAASSAPPDDDDDGSAISAWLLLRGRVDAASFAPNQRATLDKFLQTLKVYRPNLQPAPEDENDATPWPDITIVDYEDLHAASATAAAALDATIGSTSATSAQPTTSTTSTYRVLSGLEPATVYSFVTVRGRGGRHRGDVLVIETLATGMDRVTPSLTRRTQPEPPRLPLHVVSEASNARSAADAAQVAHIGVRQTLLTTRFNNLAALRAAAVTNETADYAAWIAAATWHDVAVERYLCQRSSDIQLMPVVDRVTEVFAALSISAVYVARQSHNSQADLAAIKLLRAKTRYEKRPALGIGTSVEQAESGWFSDDGMLSDCDTSAHGSRRSSTATGITAMNARATSAGRLMQTQTDVDSNGRGDSDGDEDDDDPQKESLDSIQLKEERFAAEAAAAEDERRRATSAPVIAPAARPRPGRASPPAAGKAPDSPASTGEPKWTDDPVTSAWLLRGSTEFLLSVCRMEFVAGKNVEAEEPKLQYVSSFNGAVHINKLQPATRYEVKVCRAETYPIARWSAWSPPVTFATLQRLLMEVSEMSCDYMSFKWARPRGEKVKRYLFRTDCVAFAGSGADESQMDCSFRPAHSPRGDPAMSEGDAAAEDVRRPPSPSQPAQVTEDPLTVPLPTLDGGHTHRRETFIDANQLHHRIVLKDLPPNCICDCTTIPQYVTSDHFGVAAAPTRFLSAHVACAIDEAGSDHIRVAWERLDLGLLVPPCIRGTVAHSLQSSLLQTKMIVRLRRHGEWERTVDATADDTSCIFSGLPGKPGSQVSACVTVVAILPRCRCCALPAVGSVVPCVQPFSCGGATLPPPVAAVMSIGESSVGIRWKAPVESWSDEPAHVEVKVVDVRDSTRQWVMGATATAADTPREGTKGFGASSSGSSATPPLQSPGRGSGGPTPASGRSDPSAGGTAIIEGVLPEREYDVYVRQRYCRGTFGPWHLSLSRVPTLRSLRLKPTAVSESFVALEAFRDREDSVGRLAGDNPASPNRRASQVVHLPTVQARRTSSAGTLAEGASATDAVRTSSKDNLTGGHARGAHVLASDVIRVDPQRFMFTITHLGSNEAVIIETACPFTVSAQLEANTPYKFVVAQWSVRDWGTPSTPLYVHTLPLVAAIVTRRGPNHVALRLCRDRRLPAVQTPFCQPHDERSAALLSSLCEVRVCIGALSNPHHHAHHAAHSPKDGALMPSGHNHKRSGLSPLLDGSLTPGAVPFAGATVTSIDISEGDLGTMHVGVEGLRPASRYRIDVTAVYHGDRIAPAASSLATVTLPMPDVALTNVAEDSVAITWQVSKAFRGGTAADGGTMGAAAASSSAPSIVPAALRAVVRDAAKDGVAAALARLVYKVRPSRDAAASYPVGRRGVSSAGRESNQPPGVRDPPVVPSPVAEASLVSFQEPGRKEAYGICDILSLTPKLGEPTKVAPTASPPLASGSHMTVVAGLLPQANYDLFVQPMDDTGHYGDELFVGRFRTSPFPRLVTSKIAENFAEVSWRDEKTSPIDAATGRPQLTVSPDALHLDPRPASAAGGDTSHLVTLHPATWYSFNVAPSAVNAPNHPVPARAAPILAATSHDGDQQDASSLQNDGAMIPSRPPPSLATAAVALTDGGTRSGAAGAGAFHCSSAEYQIAVFDADLLDRMLASAVTAPLAIRAKGADTPPASATATTTGGIALTPPRQTRTLSFTDADDHGSPRPPLSVKSPKAPSSAALPLSNASVISNTSMTGLPLVSSSSDLRGVSRSDSLVKMPGLVATLSAVHGKGHLLIPDLEPKRRYAVIGRTKKVIAGQTLTGAWSAQLPFRTLPLLVLRVLAVSLDFANISWHSAEEAERLRNEASARGAGSLQLPATVVDDDELGGAAISWHGTRGTTAGAAATQPRQLMPTRPVPLPPMYDGSTTCFASALQRSGSANEEGGSVSATAVRFQVQVWNASAAGDLTDLRDDTFVESTEAGIHTVNGLKPGHHYGVTLRVCYDTSSGTWVEPCLIATDAAPVVTVHQITQTSATFNYMVSSGAFEQNLACSRLALSRNMFSNPEARDHRLYEARLTELPATQKATRFFVEHEEVNLMVLQRLKRDHFYHAEVRELISGIAYGSFVPVTAFWTQPCPPVITELTECRDGVMTIRWSVRDLKTGLLASGNRVPEGLVFNLERGTRSQATGNPEPNSWEEVHITDLPEARFPLNPRNDPRLRDLSVHVFRVRSSKLFVTDPSKPAGHPKVPVWGDYSTEAYWNAPALPGPVQHLNLAFVSDDNVLVAWEAPKGFESQPGLRFNVFIDTSRQEGANGVAPPSSGVSGVAAGQHPLPRLDPSQRKDAESLVSKLYNSQLANDGAINGTVVSGGLPGEGTAARGGGRSAAKSSRRTRHGTAAATSPVVTWFFVGVTRQLGIHVPGLRPGTLYKVAVHSESDVGISHQVESISFATRIDPNLDLVGDDGGRNATRRAGGQASGATSPTAVHHDNPFVVVLQRPPLAIKGLMPLSATSDRPEMHAKNLYDKYELPKQAKLKSLAALVGIEAKTLRRSAALDRFRAAARKVMVVLRHVHRTAVLIAMSPAFDPQGAFTAIQLARRSLGLPIDGSAVYYREETFTRHGSIRAPPGSSGGGIGSLTAMTDVHRGQRGHRRASADMTETVLAPAAKGASSSAALLEESRLQRPPAAVEEPTAAEVVPPPPTSSNEPAAAMDRLLSPNPKSSTSVTSRSRIGALRDAKLAASRTSGGVQAATNVKAPPNTSPRHQDANVAALSIKASKQQTTSLVVGGAIAVAAETKKPIAAATRRATGAEAPADDALGARDEPAAYSPPPAPLPTRSALPRGGAAAASAGGGGVMTVDPLPPIHLGSLRPRQR